MEESGRLLWSPPPNADTSVSRYMDWLRHTRGLGFDDYRELQQWSVNNVDAFWQSVWEYFQFPAPTPAKVREGTQMPGVRWFPETHLNYAEQVITRAPADAPALIAVDETLTVREITTDQLARDVAGLAATLRALGVKPGDRVAGVVSNRPEAVVSLLATAAIGAIWSACAPDFGDQAVLDRLEQIEPTVLIAVTGYSFGGRWFDRRPIVATLQAKLPGLKKTIIIEPAGSVDAGSRLSGDQEMTWVDAVAPPEPLVFAETEFNDPLWILYSSGTTGVPKGIVHSHGGIVLEHIKAMHLGCGIGPGDRLFFYSSTSWMIWNWMLGAMLTGATVVLYDGSPTHPDKLGSWRVVEATGATVFGTGAAYLSAMAKNLLRPASELDLRSLTTIISTGSPLPQAGWIWVTEEFGSQVRLDSSTGGTDVCGTFVSGSPALPVYLGELSGPCLGVKVEALDDRGQALVGRQGELVISEPMPSMPIMFWNDPDGRRYHDAYFDTYPGLWRHGDFIELTERGTMIIRGRSDATLNRGGVRLGSADIYGLVETFPEVVDCLLIGVELPDGGYFMPLFIQVEEGSDVAGIEDRIKGEIRDHLSPRHVPDEVVLTRRIPRTKTGKRLEVPVKRLMQGASVEGTVSTAALTDPDALAWFEQFARERVWPLLQPTVKS